MEIRQLDYGHYEVYLARAHNEYEATLNDHQILPSIDRIIKSETIVRIILGFDATKLYDAPRLMTIPILHSLKTTCIVDVYISLASRTAST
jgi:hypothetical protein